MLIYVAHPLGGDIPGNCASVLRYLAALMRRFPEYTFVLPWVAYVDAGKLLYGDNPDGDQAYRDRCLRDDLLIADRCDAIVLCGPVVSPGMALEWGAWARNSSHVAYRATSIEAIDAATRIGDLVDLTDHMAGRDPATGKVLP